MKDDTNPQSTKTIIKTSAPKPVENIRDNKNVQKSTSIRKNKNKNKSAKKDQKRIEKFDKSGSSIIDEIKQSNSLSNSEPIEIKEIKFQSSKSNSKNKKKVNSGEEQDEDEDMKFLENLIAHKNDCFISGCKKGSKFFNSHCIHCKKYFCLNHATPEVHGCAKDAKAFARSKMK